MFLIQKAKSYILNFVFTIWEKREKKKKKKKKKIFNIPLKKMKTI